VKPPVAGLSEERQDQTTSGPARSLLEIHDLHTYFFTHRGTLKAVNGISLTLERGEIVGIVGETGSGKSTLIHSIMRIVQPPGRVVSGSIRFEGDNLLTKPEKEMRALRGQALALISPNPRSRLNPLIRVGQQIVNVIRAHQQVSRQHAIKQAAGLLDAVGIPDPELRLAAYPHELSGGMCQRIVIAMALANEPRLLMADEPTSGLDVTIQLQILDLIRDLVQRTSSATLVVTRDLSIVAHYCQRIAVMYAGQIVETCDVPTFFEGAVHPYSLALLRAAFAARGESRHLTMTGSAPNLINLPSGCFAHPRCPLANTTSCRTVMPELEAMTPGHLVRCHRKHEIT
jgi:oligopeptide/dipeptide ABC transporter ATP-binding protein